MCGTLENMRLFADSSDDMLARATLPVRLSPLEIDHSRHQYKYSLNEAELLKRARERLRRISPSYFISC